MFVPRKRIEAPDWGSAATGPWTLSWWGVTLVLAALLSVVVPTMSSAQGTSLDLSICNDGNTKLSVATARETNDAFTHALEVEGWWTVEPGDCTMVLTHFDSSFAYLAFAYNDRSGAFGFVTEVDPEDRSEPSSSPRTFQRSRERLCVPLNSFNYSGNLEELAYCPRSNEYHLTDFPVYFEPQYDLSLPEHVSYKFWLKADVDTPVTPFRTTP